LRVNSREMKNHQIFYRMVTLSLRAGLVLGLFWAGWLVYHKLPHSDSNSGESSPRDTTLQLVLRPSPEIGSGALDIPIELYPVDVVAVRHEYFTERRAGKRFDDFLNERMNGRKPVNVTLDRQGQTSVAISPGNWWVHANLSGEQDLEWRLPISVSGLRQTIELTPQNAYTRTKSF
jgi:hypothetical protein